MDLSALPAAAGILGKTYLFFTPWTPLRIFGRLEKAGLLPDSLKPLGSVGLSAVCLALRLGSGPVLTGGIDFSFSPDNYHARSTPGHREKLRKQNRFKSILGAGFRPGLLTLVSKSGVPVRSDPVMRSYRDLFEREFSGTRLADIKSNGLPLGVRTVEPEEAWELLKGKPLDPVSAPPAETAGREDKKQRLFAFAGGERKSLAELRSMLTGELPANPGRLDSLLDSLDYLWAHLPVCAGRDGVRPPASDIAFLKMVRAETDPFLKLWDRLLREIQEI
jgi:hypothetical protein